MISFFSLNMLQSTSYFVKKKCRQDLTNFTVNQFDVI